MIENKFWPESLQKPLLRAAFLPNEAGLQAWELWKSQVNMDDHPDPGSFRLLPPLYRNLQRLNVDDPLLMKLKGIVRQRWYKNQQFFRSTVPTLQQLHQAGIEPLLLYGPALALYYHSDYTLDGGTVLSILVRPEQAVKTIHLLQDSGWVSEARLPQSLIEPYTTVGFMHLFQDSIQRRLQLHWHLLPECCQSEVDASFWQEALLTDVNDVPVYVLSPTDQLLHICVQDTSTVEMTPFLRAIDAMLVIEAAKDDIDWNRLIAQARQYHLTLPLLHIFDYLQTNLDNPIPKDIYQQLRATPVARWQRIEFKSKNSVNIVSRRLSRLWFNYFRRNTKRSLLANVAGFPKYLQQYWRLKSFWEVPRQAVSAAQARLHQPD